MAQLGWLAITNIRLSMMAVIGDPSNLAIDVLQWNFRGWKRVWALGKGVLCIWQCIFHNQEWVIMNAIYKGAGDRSFSIGFINIIDWAAKYANLKSQFLKLAIKVRVGLELALGLSLMLWL